MRILIQANTDWYLYHYRLSLLTTLHGAGHEVIVLTPPGPYVSGIAAEGLRWEPLSMSRRSVNPFTESLVLLEQIRLLRRLRPDILHNFTIKNIVYGSLAARIAGIRAVVNNFEGLGFVYSSEAGLARLIRPVVDVCIRLACRPAGSRAIVLNKADYRLFLENGWIEHDRLALVRGAGVDAHNRYVPPSRPPEGPPMVLFAGRLLKEKGLDEFVEAARILARDNEIVRFVIAGRPDPGNPSSVTEAQMAMWRSWGCVDLIGHTDDMAPLLQAASIVVLVSSYGEGLPTILTEAAACAVPVISSANAGCLEFVEHGANGLVVPPGDVPSLVRAIRTLLDDPARRAAMGRAGRARVLAEFDDRKVVAQTLDVYRDVLADFPAADFVPPKRQHAAAGT